MTTAVVDTNVLASGFVRANPAAAPSQLIDAWEAGLFNLVISEPIRIELARTFEEPYFRRRLTPDHRVRAQLLLRRRATLVRITVTVQGIATHPEDDLILATALSARADYLVTGDKKLQGLRSYQGVSILSPRAFLDLLPSQEP